MGLCNRYEEEICTREGEGVFVVKRRERRDMWVYKRTIKKIVY